MRARVLVRLKPSILDAQGVTVKRALTGLGFEEVQDVRVGKVVDVELDGLGPEGPAAASTRCARACSATRSSRISRSRLARRSHRRAERIHAGRGAAEGEPSAFERAFQVSA
jgi:phosphoribosylformylglycinamidine synthase